MPFDSSIRDPAAVMRVLHVVLPDVAGGRETAVKRLATAQHQSGYETHVAPIVLIDPVWSTFVEPLMASGVAVHPIAIGRRAYLRQRAEVARLCRSLRPDVVHTHGYRVDVLHVGTARRLGIPAVTTVHGLVGGDRKNRLYERLQVYTFRRFDAVVAVSRAQLCALVDSGVPEARIHLLPNAGWDVLDPLSPADARGQLGVDGGGFHVGWVGRLSPEKGPDLLVEALSYLEDLPLVVSVVGSGPEGERLRAQAAARGVDRRLRWHGLVSDAARLLTAFDVLVLSSRTEGVPMVLLEAMAAGVPIVATAVGGIPDVVTNDEAVLVPSDDPRALAAAVRGVCADLPAARVRAAAARRRLLAEFSVTRWVSGYHAVYSQAQRAGSD